MSKFLGALALAALIAAPSAGADVKAGVDAWARGDFAQAVAEWRPLAIAGDPDAQFNLGQAYKLGRGVPIDPAQALEWFRKAAERGHQQAQDNYGIGLFQAGRKAEALPWLERSAARGEPRTQLVLGTMLFNGDGVRIDYPRAYALMTRASQAGLPSASETLAQMDGFVSPADRQRGLQLAQSYPTPASAAAAETRTTQAEVPAPKPGRPPVRTAQAPATRPPASAPAARPAPAAVAKPAPTARPAPAPKPTPARTGNWRIQLGAFRDRDNAEGLWRRVGGRVGGQPAYVMAGKVVRLQATGFANRADAQRACRAASVACVVVAP